MYTIAVNEASVGESGVVHEFEWTMWFTESGTGSGVKAPRT
jgi:hypothetical protein